MALLVAAAESALLATPASVVSATALPHAASERSQSGGEWIRHEVIPRERLDDIAARYGVTRAALIRWNRLDPNDPRIYAGRKLKVKANTVPAPRERITYVVQRGDTWHKIAEAHGLSEKDVRAWNGKLSRRLAPRNKVTLYVDPKPPEATPEAPLPEFYVRPGGLSIGRPNRGRIANSVQLPNSDLYSKRKPEVTWGTSHTVLQVQKSIAKFRRDSGFVGPIVIGAMSKRGGGRLHPHNSHQSGRDVDVGLPMIDGSDPDRPRYQNIDWRAAWRLVSSFLDTGEVEYVFLEYRLQRHLREAASSAGVSSAELQKLFEWPQGRGAKNRVIKHSDGHVTHVHVRIKCSSEELQCTSY